MNQYKKSIWIYTVTVLVITFLYEGVQSAAGIEYGSLHSYAFSVIIMWLPASAVWITKLICREQIRIGLQSDIPYFTGKRNMRNYLPAAILTPILCTLLGNLFIYALHPSDYDWSSISQKTVFANFLLVLGETVIYSFLQALGEEIGWRGFLMPRLERVMKRPLMLLCSGIIWGIWHLPLLVQGHVFGLDYSGAPWKGSFLFVVFCILYGAWIYWLYQESGSILIAAAAHSAYNTAFSILTFMGVKEEAFHTLNQFEYLAIYMLVNMLPGIWALIRLCTEEKRKKN